MGSLCEADTLSPSPLSEGAAPCKAMAGLTASLRKTSQSFGVATAFTTAYP